MKKLEVINPSTGKKIREYDSMSSQEVQAIIEKMQISYVSWRRTSFAERAKLLRQAAQILRNKKTSLATLMGEEMGKIYAQGIGEVEKCAWVCEYYADQAAAFLSNEPVATEAQESFVSFQPLGIVLAVMPWNFPLWQVFRFAAPALMAGNGGLLKHASNVPGCALAIEEIFQEAGFPQNIFRSVLIGGAQVAEVIAHPSIKAVTLTGSTPAGKAVASKAGAMLKKTVLELGGSDPYVILEDANLEEAVKACVTSRLINSGQSCIAAKRFIVVKPLIEKFEAAMLELMQNIRLGDPFEEGTQLGPMARIDLRDEIHQQVLESLNQGANCLLGGNIPDREGAYYPATILNQVKPGMPAYDDEIFGPVAAIIEAKDEQQAIDIANDSIFGLGAALFTQNLERGKEIAEKYLEAGACFVNDYVRSDPRLPFGGIKESGYGRELSTYGIREFVNIKTVYIK